MVSLIFLRGLCGYVWVNLLTLSPPRVHDTGELTEHYFCFSVHSQGLTEAKKQNHDLIERVQAMQNELSDSEVRRAELETQIRQSHTLLVQRQEQEQELNKKMQKVGMSVRGSGFWVGERRGWEQKGRARAGAKQEDAKAMQCNTRNTVFSCT